MGFIFNRDHHILIRLGARAAVNRMANQSGNSPDQQQGADNLAGNVDGSFDSVVERAVAQQHTLPAAGQAALNATPVAGQPHPFLQWLFSAQGIAWIEAIIQVVATIMGWKIPPLPVPLATAA